MKFTTFSSLLLLSAAPLALAAIGDSCTASEGTGTCQQSSDCGTGGFTVKGACPKDGNSVLCCIKKTCSTPSGKGACENTASGCSGGVFLSGYCPGDSSVKCCVPSSGGTTPPPSSGDGGSGILAKAKTQTGVPYSWGGGGCDGKYEGRTGVGFDCSGLTQYAICQWSKARPSGQQIKLPRVAKDQYRFGPRVPVAERQVGDLIYYGEPNCDGYENIYHTAIYAGNGKMFEAQKTGTNVGEYNMRTTNLCPFAVRHWA